MSDQNIYDNEAFFEGYMKLRNNPSAANDIVEKPALFSLCPDLTDKKVLDLGCGFGWHCKYASDNGAIYVLGTDISKRMLQKAQEINSADNIEYQQIAMEDLNLSKESFDIILSSLAFHYVEDFISLIKNIYSWLKPGGDFVFSVEHPIFTSAGSQDWYYDDNGEILHFPVDNYYYEGKREAIFLDEKVTKYHRTLTTYIETLLNNGFLLTNIVEPQPPEEMMDLPGMKDEMRRPMMLLIACKKPL